jgi:hypothetical protein
MLYFKAKGLGNAIGFQKGMETGRGLADKMQKFIQAAKMSQNTASPTGYQEAGNKSSQSASLCQGYLKYTPNNFMCLMR